MFLTEKMRLNQSWLSHRVASKTCTPGFYQILYYYFKSYKSISFVSAFPVNRVCGYRESDREKDWKKMGT